MNSESLYYRRPVNTLLIVDGEDGAYIGVCKSCGERTASLTNQSIRDKTAVCARGCKS
jgi:hypothetical protein